METIKARKNFQDVTFVGEVEGKQGWFWVTDSSQRRTGTSGDTFYMVYRPELESYLEGMRSSLFCRSVREKRRQEEENRIAQVMQHSGDTTHGIHGIWNDLSILHKAVQFQKEDYQTALFEGVVGMIIDWVWRRNEVGGPAGLHIFIGSFPYRLKEEKEDRCTVIFRDSLNQFCRDVQKELHERYLDERKNEKWFMEGRPFEWYADRNGYLASEFVENFICLLAKVIQDKRVEKEGNWAIIDKFYTNDRN